MTVRTTATSLSSSTVQKDRMLLNGNSFSLHRANFFAHRMYVCSEHRCVMHNHRECVNTVRRWQRRMCATLLTHYASIADITVRHSTVEHEHITHRTAILSLILSKTTHTSKTSAELIIK